MKVVETMPKTEGKKAFRAYIYGKVGPDPLNAAVLPKAMAEAAAQMKRAGHVINHVEIEYIGEKADASASE